VPLGDLDSLPIADSFQKGTQGITSGFAEICSAGEDDNCVAVGGNRSLARVSSEREFLCAARAAFTARASCQAANLFLLPCAFVLSLNF
jgi:hypothetical protein